MRIAAGEANAVIGCDMIVAASDEAIAKMQAGHTRAVVNTDVAPTGAFTRDPDLAAPAARHRRGDRRGLRPGRDRFHRGGGARHGAAGRLHRDQPLHGRLRLAEGAWSPSDARRSCGDRAERRGRGGEQGGLRLGAARRRRRRGRAQGGRRRRRDLPDSLRLSESLDEAFARRRAELVRYQDEAYAGRYEKAVARVREAEARRVPGSTALTQAAARYLFKLMAYKDEYEVARLYADGDFLARVARQFEGDYRLTLHLAPPLLVGDRSRHRRAAQGRLRAVDAQGDGACSRSSGASRHGARSVRPFAGTARGAQAHRGVRGDSSRRSPSASGPATLAIAVDLASLPEHIRGYGPVKARHLALAAERRTALLAQLRDPATRRPREGADPDPGRRLRRRVRAGPGPATKACSRRCPAPAGPASRRAG